jgi:glycosyltransferase involved in cell wall biosynthesis
MKESFKKRTFGVYINNLVKTSGRRFYSDLFNRLTDQGLPLEGNPQVILFNVSAPLKLILKAKLTGIKVVIRFDGLYFDRLSPLFIEEFPRFFGILFNLGIKLKFFHDYFAFLANLFSRNYGAFLRILISDVAIYQSKFSEKIYDKYFWYKKRKVILNGASFKVREINNFKEGIDIALIYDQGRPSKRIPDIVRFIDWANEIKHEDIRLSILGYTGIIPAGVSSDFKSIIESKSFIKTYDRFNEFDSKVSFILSECDMYISFSYRDACPNVVVEAMAHGLPVVGLASGGVPEIVGDAGILLAMDDFEEGFYSAHRFEDDFPPFSLEEMLDAVKKVKANNVFFRNKVRERFETELEMDLVAKKYVDVLNELI